MGQRGKESLVLLSGGIDSAACTKYYLDSGYEVHSIFIDYGQLPANREFGSAEKIASYYGIDLIRLTFNSKQKYGAGEIEFRNAFLIFSSLLSCPSFKGLVSMGIHAGTRYYDCSEAFVLDINRILSTYSDGEITFDAPFLKWTKAQIVEFCKKRDVPLNLTYSCEEGGDIPCGKCLSCIDRRTSGVC
jgi:7-cyano-7-deazaguanine synthase